MKPYINYKVGLLIRSDLPMNDKEGLLDLLSDFRDDNSDLILEWIPQGEEELMREEAQQLFDTKLMTSETQDYLAELGDTRKLTTEQQQELLTDFLDSDPKVVQAFRLFAERRLELRGTTEPTEVPE